MSSQPLQKPGMKQPGVIRRQSIQVSQEMLVREEYLRPGQTLPLVIRPAIAGVNLIEWARERQSYLATQLLKHGGVLFRGFNIQPQRDFQTFVGAVSREMLQYQDRATPRSEVGGGIYTSTDYPANQTIEFHNENSYASSWPGRIFFCCVTAALEGGETPIADSRNVFARIDPDIRERLIQKKVMYVRNFGDGLGISWQTAFQTTDKAILREYCRKSAIELEWKDANRLRTRQIRPAAIRHPQTNEWVWFNQATAFHFSTLDVETQAMLLAELGQQDLPKNAFYGDGTPIDGAVLDAIRDAYRQETICFPWQKGDILMLDNMLVAHGRAPFVGPRKVVVGMADLYSWADVQQAGPVLSNTR